MVDSETLSWLRSESWIFGLAAIGGVIVLIGLWMEYVSTDEKRYGKTDIQGFRKLKAKEKRGEIWVMAGIAVEIAVAVGFACRDDWHIRQIENAQKNADPRFRTISDIAATVSFRVNKANFLELPHFGNPKREADMWLMESAQNAKIVWPGLEVANDRIWYLNGSTEFPILATDHLESFPSKADDRTYFMECHIDNFDGAWSEFMMLQRTNFAKDIDRVSAIRISVKCLPHNLAILDGTVKLVINDSVVKMLQIPKQGDNRDDDKMPDIYSNTSPYVILAFATNSPSH